MSFLYRLYQRAVSNLTRGSTGTGGQVETCRETQEANRIQMPKWGRLLSMWADPGIYGKQSRAWAQQGAHRI